MAGYFAVMGAALVFLLFRSPYIICFIITTNYSLNSTFDLMAFFSFLQLDQRQCLARC